MVCVGLDRVLLVRHPNKLGQTDVCSLFPLKGHTTAREMENSLAILKQPLVMGKLAKCLSFSKQVQSASCRPVVEKQSEFANEKVKAWPPVAHRLGQQPGKMPNPVGGTQFSSCTRGANGGCEKTCSEAVSVFE